MNRLIITLLISGLFTCCFSPTGKDDFYSYTRSRDLWRLPLAEPYELISPTNSPDGWRR